MVIRIGRIHGCNNLMEGKNQQVGKINEALGQMVKVAKQIYLWVNNWDMY